MNLTGMCRNYLTRLGLANRPRDDDDAVKVQTRVLRTRTDGRKEGRGGAGWVTQTTGRGREAYDRYVKSSEEVYLI